MKGMLTKLALLAPLALGAAEARADDGTFVGAQYTAPYGQGAPYYGPAPQYGASPYQTPYPSGYPNGGHGAPYGYRGPQGPQHEHTQVRILPPAGGSVYIYEGNALIATLTQPDTLMLVTGRGYGAVSTRNGR